MEPSTRADLFDPAALATLGHIEVVARWIVDGFLSGLHRSPRKGFSVEFADFRPYQPGDDLRYVDWKIAARADRWVVKQYEEETNLRATLVLDVSRSMEWRSALALQVEGIEDLGFHFALLQHPRRFDETIGQGGLPVVDMGDDAEVSDVVELH